MNKTTYSLVRHLSRRTNGRRHSGSSRCRRQLEKSSISRTLLRGCEMKLTWVVGRRNSEGGQKEESDSDSFVEDGGYDLCGPESCWSEVVFTRLIYKTSGFPEISGPVKRTVRSMEQCIKTRTKVICQIRPPITSNSHQ